MEYGNGEIVGKKKLLTTFVYIKNVGAMWHRSRYSGNCTFDEVLQAKCIGFPLGR